MCRFAVNYAKYKELGKALSIRAFGVSELENAVFLFKNAEFEVKKRRFHHPKTPFFSLKTPFSQEKTAFSNRGSSILC